MTAQSLTPQGSDSALEIAGYGELLESLKRRIREAQVRAALAVNRELVLLYWQIGREILARQQTAGWGARIIDRLSQDLRRAFPDMSGFSARNLKYMRAFAEAYPEESIVQQAVAQSPTGCWTNSLGRQRGAPRHAQDPPRFRVVRAPDDRAPLESRSIRHRIGVAEYRLTEELPRQLQDSLPTVEELEREIRELGELPDVPGDSVSGRT